MNIKWNEYTWYSKTFAAIFFILIFPAWTFYLGTQFGEVWSMPSVNISAQKNDTISYQMTSVPTTEESFLFPHITQSPDPKITEIVNRKLLDLQNSLNCFGNYGETLDQFRIDEMGAIKASNPSITDDQIKKMSKDDITLALGWSFGVSAEVTNTSKNIFSVKIDAYYDCGGAHPNEADQSVTFDMMTGNQIALKDLFIDFDANAQKLADIVFSENNMSVGNEVDCSDPDIIASEKENFIYSPFHIENGKLYIFPSLPHVAVACAVDTEVPLSSIKQFINPQGILIRLLK